MARPWRFSERAATSDSWICCLPTSKPAAAGSCSTETSKTWIELNNELSFLTHSREFVWASARDGYLHLYLYDYEGHLLRPLTAGPWNVDDFRARAIKGIDEKNRWVYFTATEKSPTERQLYRTSLDTQDPQKIDRSLPG